LQKSLFTFSYDLSNYRKTYDRSNFMTFSITGHCPRSGMVGVAITTSSIAVGSRCPHVRAGVGAVATQNITMPQIGPSVLDWLQAGDNPEVALASVMDRERFAEFRQVAVVDSHGNTALFSGPRTLGTHGTAIGKGVVAAGNLLKSALLPQVMVDHFTTNANLHLADRLLSALEAGLASGGEEGPVHSACLLVAHEHSWPLVDLRVDWHDTNPIAQLRKLWTAYEPQMLDYVNRAIDPNAAPSYGVPGDE
jgi:uncharacterized Ntn-hydrolase superfamily protein